MKSKNFIKILFFLLIVNVFACNTGMTPQQRLNLNPTPQPPVKQSVSVLVPKFDDSKKSELDITPIETPKVDLSKFVFEVEIKFDGILGRAIIDDGPLLNTPVKLKLNGGYHKIEVFDLILPCRIAQYYLIDKDQTLDLTGPRGCRIVAF